MSAIPPTPPTPATPPSTSWLSILTAIGNEAFVGAERLRELKTSVFFGLLALFTLTEGQIWLVVHHPDTLLIVSMLSLAAAGFVLYQAWNEILLAWELGLGTLVALNDLATIQQKVPQYIKAVQVVFATSIITYLIWLPLAVMIAWLYPTVLAHPEYNFQPAYLLPIVGVFLGLASLAANTESKLTVRLGISLAIGIMATIPFVIAPQVFPTWVVTVFVVIFMMAALELGGGKVLMTVLSFMGTKKFWGLVILALLVWLVVSPSGCVGFFKNKATEVGDAIVPPGSDTDTSQQKPAKTAPTALEKKSPPKPFVSTDPDRAVYIGTNGGWEPRPEVDVSGCQLQKTKDGKDFIEIKPRKKAYPVKIENGVTVLRVQQSVLTQEERSGMIQQTFEDTTGKTRTGWFDAEGRKSGDNNVLYALDHLPLEGQPYGLVYGEWAGDKIPIGVFGARIESAQEGIIEIRYNVFKNVRATEGVHRLEKYICNK